MNKVTIITGGGLRLEINGACGVSTRADRQVVVHAPERDISVELPPTAAVTSLFEEEEV